METKYKGLTEQEAKQKLQESGFNEIAFAVKKRNVITIALEAIREPMILLLLVAGVIYLILGDAKEAGILLFFVSVIICILIFQQQKTERVLEKLRDLTSPRALVIREGLYKRIDGREVVHGEILILQEGDRIVADAAILESHDLRVDESLLTGESVSVEKKAGVNLSSDLNKVYLGTMVTQGQAIAEVIATGSNSELGKIGRSVQEVKTELTPLQLTIKRLVRMWAFIGIMLCVFIVIVYYITRHSLLGGVLAGITFAMATLPEEFPLILTVFFALGAWRISKHHVLTRQLPAIEALGAMTVLCVDKTGTLTRNQMAVSRLYANDQFHELTFRKGLTLPESFHELIAYGILASELKPFDAMELAFHELGEHLLISPYLPPDRTLVHEYELTPDILAMTHVWQVPNQKDYIIASKGAPETIFKLCKLSDLQIRNLSEQMENMAKDGLRLLAVAKATYSGDKWPILPNEFNFQFLGLVGLSDPIRPQAPWVVKNCQQAGIRVILMTGDYPVTAVAIAKQLHITNENIATTGSQIESLSMDELQEIVKKQNVFTRILPRQKLRIINALKANKEVIAMTGDGVNDAPALKAAHIGIAMGERGTDVAREASSVILLNDDLSSIVAATRLGRRIFSNIQKAMAYIVAIHIPIAGLSLIPLLLGWPLLFFPIHIAFLQLIIDPTCGIAFEAEPQEPNIMQVPPRKISSPLFTKTMIILSLIQGVIVLLVIAFVYGFAIRLNIPANQARALSFASLVFANLGLIQTNRSWNRSFVTTFKTQNRVMWWILAGAVCFLMLIIYIPFFQALFQFSALSFSEILLCFLIGIGSVFWFEIYKWLSPFVVPTVR